MKRRTIALPMLPFLLGMAANLSNAAGRDGAGAVYLMTNQPANRIQVFHRDQSGALTPGGSFATGGAGGQALSGNPFDPLASQGSLLLSHDRHLLFAVNAGSNEVSVFGVDADGLTLLDRTSSGGVTPVSLALSRDTLYVLNAGEAANVTGFSVDRSGKLSAIPGATRLLPGGAAAAPAQVEISPDGDLLVVSEKNTNTLVTYGLQQDGSLTGPSAQNSNGLTPFGLTFARPELLIVSEAFGGADGQAALSSYRAQESASLRVESASVPDHQTAACWVVVSANGRFAYTTNTATAVVSGYAVDGSGRLSLLNADGVTAATGASTNPIDMAVAGPYLYVHLNGPNGRGIVGYRIGVNGALSEVTRVSGLPAAAQGIAAQ